MKIIKIIETIEILKSDFQSRHGVEPNTCTLSEDLYMELTHYFNNRIKRADAFEINKICGMNLSIGLENEISVQVGYFGKPCCVEWEE